MARRHKIAQPPCVVATLAPGGGGFEHAAPHPRRAQKLISHLGLMSGSRISCRHSTPTSSATLSRISDNLAFEML
eukprot:1041282-Pyramimonas_sp.AAC.1